MMLQVLVTAHGGGEFRYFPRLQTALAQLRAQLEGQIILIDAGWAWSAESWVCQVTENRAPYLILDAMAYTAAFADGLNVENFGILRHQVAVKLTDDFQGFHLTIQAEQLLIQRHLGAEAVLTGNMLKLPIPPQFTIYQVSLALQPWAIQAQIAHTFPPTTLPNSTLAGMVEFVVGEARYYQQQSKKSD